MLLSLTEAAARSGRSPAALKRQVSRGNLPATHGSRRKILVEEADLALMAPPHHRKAALPAPPKHPTLAVALEAMTQYSGLPPDTLRRPPVADRYANEAQAALRLVLLGCGASQAQVSTWLGAAPELCGDEGSALLVNALAVPALRAALEKQRNYGRWLGRHRAADAFSAATLGSRLGFTLPLEAVANYLQVDLLGTCAVRQDEQACYRALRLLTQRRLVWAAVAQALIGAGEQGAVHLAIHHAALLRLPWRHDPYAVLGGAP